MDVSSKVTCTDLPGFEGMLGGSKFDIDFACDRSGSIEVAKWFTEGLDATSMFGLNSEGDTQPDKLNFAFEGIMNFSTMDLSFTCSPQVRFAQGHTALTEDNWWVACPGGAKGTDDVYTYLQCSCNKEEGWSVYFYADGTKDDRFAVSSEIP